VDALTPSRPLSHSLGMSEQSRRRMVRPIVEDRLRQCIVEFLLASYRCALVRRYPSARLAHRVSPLVVGVALRCRPVPLRRARWHRGPPCCKEGLVEGLKCKVVTVEIVCVGVALLSKSLGIFQQDRIARGPLGLGPSLGHRAARIVAPRGP